MSRRPQAPELDPLVREFQHDQHRPRAADALLSLRKIASLVKPIMRQRNWHVGVLCEFYPEQANLLGLNINRGAKICLRLRYPGDERQFMPIEEVVDTMLHELCHIVHGPHDQVFNDLWNQLRDEHEALIRKGYTGEGFLSHGKKLGGTGRIPMHEARRRARAAAEKRQAQNQGSGQRLGGKAVQRGVDMRRVIANAAQRRITVTKGCASGTDQGRDIARDVETNLNGFRTKAEEDDANERAIMQAHIEMLQEEEREKYGSDYVPPSEANPAGPRATLSPPTPSRAPPSSVGFGESGLAIRRTPQRDPSPAFVDLTDSPDKPQDKDPFSWTCEACTLINPQELLYCEVCATERPIVTFSAPPPSSRPSSKRASKAQGSYDDPRVLKPRQTLSKSLAILDKQEAEKKQKQAMGWLCSTCGNWMENQWWTCAGCGAMKASS